MSIIIIIFSKMSIHKEFKFSWIFMNLSCYFQYKNFKPKYSSCSYLKAAKCLDKWAKQNSWHSLRVINVCFMTICHCMEPTRNRQPIPNRPPHPHHTPCCQGRNRNLDGWVAGWLVGSSRPNQTECNEGLK